MLIPKQIHISDYDYPLPDERIARHPCEPRDACKLMVRSNDGAVSHHIFTELPGLLPAGSLMVCNNTRVINARIKMRKPTGAEIEIFCLEPEEPRDYALAFQAKGECQWVSLVGNLKRWKGGLLSKECPDFTLTAELGEDRPGNAHVITFRWDNPTLTFADVISQAGYIPIPPYLCRASEQSDTIDYQTVYSKIKGSVAAPTAGLHFTQQVLDDIRANDIDIRELTLHVGAGTFQPVKSDTIGEHPMHTETISIDRGLLDTLIKAKQAGRPLTAVGTTSVRTLESLPHLGRQIQTMAEPELHITQWQAYQEEFDTLEALQALADYMDAREINHLTASTAIMIAPGYKWRMVDNIVTNFHQPQSTLLLLVASWLQAHGDLTGCEWRSLYDNALEHGYRFLSYGDSMLFKTL
ncbi:MAG: S-adenosylmethionine:tRNA ribosyltransferase-isomerase [Muribaculaceae bacterium]|nr:S-adenosylmethionine:tRNA ribosyltransferase-isomerase [Muribaculaceae bacterium]